MKFVVSYKVVKKIKAVKAFLFWWEKYDLF